MTTNAFYTSGQVSDTRPLKYGPPVHIFLSPQFQRKAISAPMSFRLILPLEGRGSCFPQTQWRYRQDKTMKTHNKDKTQTCVVSFWAVERKSNSNSNHKHKNFKNRRHSKTMKTQTCVVLFCVIEQKSNINSNHKRKSQEQSWDLITLQNIRGCSEKFPTLQRYKTFLQKFFSTLHTSPSDAPISVTRPNSTRRFSTT